MITDDKFIELITVGINRLAMANAEVEWNVKIDKRQFDVLATIESGFYSVLVAFEVKHRKRPVSVEMMDAFVTKMADRGINKGVFVCTSSYQSGAIGVAEKHGIDLFKISFIDGPPKPPEHILVVPTSPQAKSTPPIIEYKGETIGNAVEKVVLHYASGKSTELPSESSQLNYYLRKTTAAGKSLHDWIEAAAVRPVPVDEQYTERIPVDEVIIPPDEFFFKGGKVASITIEVVARKGHLLGGNASIELSAFSQPVLYENVITGEKHTTEISKLPMGPRTLEVGNFYFQYFPLRYFYCEKIEDGIVTVWLVESFQSGILNRSIFKIEMKYATHYIPLKDGSIIKRLRKRLDTLRKLHQRDRSN